MLDAEEGPTGQFHTGKSGIAGVGDGGDFGIHFGIVSEDLKTYLESHKAYLEGRFANHRPWNEYALMTQYAHMNQHVTQHPLKRDDWLCTTS